MTGALAPSRLAVYRGLRPRRHHTEWVKHTPASRFWPSAHPPAGTHPDLPHRSLFTGEPVALLVDCRLMAVDKDPSCVADEARRLPARSDRCDEHWYPVWFDGYKLPKRLVKMPYARKSVQKTLNEITAQSRPEAAITRPEPSRRFSVAPMMDWGDSALST